MPPYNGGVAVLALSFSVFHLSVFKLQEYSSIVSSLVGPAGYLKRPIVAGSSFFLHAIVLLWVFRRTYKVLLHV